MYPLSLTKFKTVGEHRIEQYRVVILTDCVSAGLIEYAHVALVLEANDLRPIYAVASEVNKLAQVTGGGSHFLCTYDDRHGNYGSSDDWGDLAKFTQEALRLINLRFEDKPLDPNVHLDHIIQVVIVDDIPETRENIKKLLMFDIDFKVIGTGANGLEALETVKSLRPDVVLMDIRMPEMDGVEAARRIKAQYPMTKVILMSIHSDSDSLTQAAKAGASDFLAKPIDMDVLYQSIRSAATGHASTHSEFNEIVKKLKGTT